MKFTALTGLVLATSAMGATWDIAVGKDQRSGNPGVGFDPSRVVPQVGDTIRFHMLQGEHWIIQGAFSSPCYPGGGFDSGLRTVANGTTDQSGPEFTYEVTQTEDPVYFYDGANTQCQQGSVFCINTDEGSDNACHIYESGALALGQQQGVTRPGFSTTSAASSTSTSSSAPVTTTGTSTGLSQAPSGTSASGTGAAGRVGVMGGVLAGVVGAAVLFL